MTIKISVLDQSFARSRDQADVAFQETVAMAQYCESIGYERFWVSEHHAFASIAGSAPEILLARLGAATQSIKLGSGGIMLPHYSPYKVAEVFSMLGNFYPDRIELGIGRAPGADMSTAAALAPDGKPRFHAFPQQTEQLLNYLRNDKATPMVSPKPPAGLPVWMLGSSSDSAALAAQLGLPYNLGLFINPQADSDTIRRYKQSFQANEHSPPAHGMITIGVFCAQDEATARALQLSYDINFFRFITGTSEGKSLSPQEALRIPISPQLKQFIAQREPTRAIGTVEQVREKVLQLSEKYDADEVMAVTNMYYFEDRKASFKLLKEAFSND